MSSVIGSVAGGLLGGAAGSGGGAPSLGSIYPNAFQNSQSYQGLAGNNIANANTAQSSAAPAALATFNQAQNNPYTAAFQQGAGTAGSALTGVGNQSLANSSALSGASNSLLPYMQQVMNQGADPQNALFNQQQQLVTNQSNAQNAANGITGPWAAGTTGQNLSNFDINWQNNQLNRALQALSGGGAALGQAGQGFNQAQSIGGQGAQDIYAGTGLPYNTANQITGQQNTNINDLINSLGGINNIDSGTMQSLLQYLGQAGNYALGQNQSQQNATKSGAAGGSILGGQLGGALSGLF
jgi:hypothetical protein